MSRVDPTADDSRVRGEVTDAEWWAQVRRQRDLGQQTAGPAQLALWRMTKGRHVAEAVIRRVPGIGLELPPMGADRGPDRSMRNRWVLGYCFVYGYQFQRPSHFLGVTVAEYLLQPRVGKVVPQEREAL